MADIDLTESSEVTIADAVGVNKLKVNTDGSLNVNTTGGVAVSLKGFGISKEFTPTGTNETPVILLKNPSENTVNLILYNMLASALAADVGSIIRLYANPTVTSVGTALTVTNFTIGSGVSSVMLSYSYPTISSNGILLLTSSILKAITAESDRTFELPRIALPNNSFLITIENTATNRTIAVTTTWLEGL